MASTPPAQGTQQERERWISWARRNRLVNQNGHFTNTRVLQRRSVFRNGLDAKDLLLTGMIEKCLIDVVHFRNSVTERWPETIRRMLADPGTGAARPFESWVGPQGLEKRKQGTRVWTDLMQYFVLEYHINNMTWQGNVLNMRGSEGYLPDVGLRLSEDFGDDIMDIVQASMIGPDYMEDAIQSFALSIIMHENPTPRNNPLLFWVALLLQTEEFGNQPRLEFGGLRDSLTMREKLEAIVHYARVFMLDYAFKGWRRLESVREEWNLAVSIALDSGGWQFTDDGTPRPAEKEGDPADFTQPHWQSFKDHFDGLRTKWLVKGSNSPIGVILQL
jgi:hypothetical protein